MHHIIFRLLLLTGVCVAFCEPATGADITTKLARVVDDLTRENYQLRYAYQDGEQLRYRVEHVATVETRMKGTFQTSKSRSESMKCWRVTRVSSDDDTMQFEQSIESVDMWNEVSDRDPVRYNSETDERAPEQYANVADTLQKPLSRITIDPFGKIVARQDFVQQYDMGMGGISIPLPAEAVPVGFEWSTPLDLRLRDQQQRPVLIKTRQVFRLQKVSAGVATISVQTQVLTPITNAAVRSQIVQRLSNGELKFDLDAGRIIRRELDWNETVIGFSGPDSNMKYMARLIEELADVSPAPETLANREPGRSADEVETSGDAARATLTADTRTR